MSPAVMLRRDIMLLAIGSLVLCVATSAQAQLNLERDKTGAQLYASDCADCHKSRQSVSRATGVFGVENFLREHYTTSGASAAAIATYLKGLNKLVSSQHGRAAKRTESSVPTPSESKEGKPRPPSDIQRPPADIKSERR